MSSWTSLERPSLGCGASGNLCQPLPALSHALPCRVQGLLPQILLQIHPLSPLRAASSPERAAGQAEHGILHLGLRRRAGAAGGSGSHMSMLQRRSRLWVYLCAWPSSPDTEPCGLEMRRTGRRPGVLSGRDLFSLCSSAGLGKGHLPLSGSAPGTTCTPCCLCVGKGSSSCPSCKQNRGHF